MHKPLQFSLVCCRLSCSSPSFVSINQVICQNIVAGKLRFPRGNAFDQPARDLCKQLLSMSSSDRPGMGQQGSQGVLEHPYFENFDFAAYTKKTLPAPWLPPMKGDADASNFDPFDVDNTIDKSYKDKGDWDKDF
jgi:hypothetical protein